MFATLSTSTKTMVVALIFVSAGQAGAGILRTPNGNFTGNGQTQTANNVEVRLIAPSYVNGGAPQGLMDALTAQNFNWTLSGIQTGDFRLDTYQAWVNTMPAVNVYGFTDTPTANNGAGGADIAIGYVPGANDPAPADARWLQVIRTNAALDWGNSHGVGLIADPGFTWYIDNGWPDRANPQRDPFYGADDNNNATGYWGNGRGLVDQPSRGLADGIHWEAWAFLAVRDVPNNGLTIYDGVHWGFTMTTVPTPGAAALAVLGGLVAYRRRR